MTVNNFKKSKPTDGGFTQHHFIRKSGAGFTLIELLIYTAVFTIAVGVFSGVLITFTRVETQTSVDSELTQQLSFVQSTIQRLVRDSANIENPAGVASSSLVLRMASTTSDPTIISSDANGIYLKQGTEEVIPLTNDQVKVSQFQITKYENPGAHAIVQINVSLAYNSENPYQQKTRSLKIAIGRVSAATFDDSLIPNTDNSFSLGVASTNRWKDINISNLLNVGQLAADPVAGAQNGSIYYNTASSTFRGYTNGSWSRLGGVGWESSSTAIYNTNSGNVGIGTASPGAKLDVSGRIRTTEFQLGIASTTAGYILIADADGVGTWQVTPTSMPASPQTGDVVYYDGSNWLKLPVGAVGQTLKMALDSYTKLLTHADGTDGGVAFTDETGKTITNTANYDTYTKLLIHFDGADGATTYTAETGQTATFAGNAQLDTADKKFGSASLLSDGEGDYVSVPDSADWDFGTGDFTIDFWIHPNSMVENEEYLFGQSDNPPTVAGQAVRAYIESNGAIMLSIFGNGGNFTAYSSSGYTDGWHHIACVRNGANLFLFVDGELDIGQSTVNIGATNSINQVASYFAIGGLGLATGQNQFKGWIDEFRISKGIARWTANFTPPASAYGTVATVTSQKEFGTASGLFDGSGSYLSLADSADFAFGSGDFTIDGWVRFSGLSSPYGAQIIVAKWDNGTAQYSYRLWFGDGGTNTLYFDFYDGSSNLSSSYAWSPSINTWYHLAIVRSNTSIYAFVNGSQIGSAYNIGTTASNTSTAKVSIGVDTVSGVAGSYFFNGYIDELRISKGIARWTANFTPPASAHSPMPNWSN